MNMNHGYVMLFISLIIIIVVTVLILKITKKKQIHFAFISMLVSIFIWTFGYIGLFYIYETYNYNSLLFINIIITGTVLTPVSIYFLGHIFAHTRIELSWKKAVVLIIPVLSLGIAYTNQYHGLFYSYFDAADKTNRVFGEWNSIHVIYSYFLIITGLWYLLYFSIKNSGFFSKQSKLIICGIGFPLIVNIIITLNAGNLPYYFETIAFTVGLLFFLFAILKFKFLNVVPIALQRIVDLISDSYIVINENYEIIDYNQTFIDTFKNVTRIKRKDTIIELLEKYSHFNIDSSRMMELNKLALNKRKAVAFEKHIVGPNFDKHFKIELIPIYTKDNYIGSIILLKDITYHIKSIELIKRNQQVLMERERLASLGELIGGIAHNLKTPIMSLSGGLEGLKDLICEYEESIADMDVTKNDHYEIATEMKGWITKLKPHLSYMSDIISAVKDQAVHLNASTNSAFTIKELVKRVEILMKHELKRHYCKLNMNVQVDLLTEVNGEINNLIQVLNNLILNAIQAYGKNRGEIDLSISKKEENLLFVVKDYACGMDEDVKNKLFKQMFTTKGKNGTGLGLYMSYSTIKGRFGGEMLFESEKGKGTTFYITMPLKYESTKDDQNEFESMLLSL